VAVAASYPKELANAFRAFLAQGGIEVVHMGCLGIWSAEEVGHLGREAVLRLVRENDHPAAEAVLIPDTAMHTVALLPDIEAEVGKTVLTANQVTMWEALRLGGRLTPQRNLGSLLAVAPQSASPAVPGSEG
jgi:maleate cis-trans isomerase